MNKNKFLKEESELVLRKQGTLEKYVFTIEKVIGSGSFMTAYEAICNDQRGLLKELTPNNLLLKREDQQLIALGNNSKHELEEMEQTFFEKMHQIDLMRSHSPEAKALNNYLPAYSLYEGIAKEGEMASGYYFVPYDPNGIVFSDYIKKKKKTGGLTYVRNVLSSIKSLTDCVYLLHQNGYLHLDLKPENFLMRTNSTNESENSAYLFDISSLYDMGSFDEPIQGTVGYVAPEIEKYHFRPTVTSDIYSIGVILFNSLIDPFDHEKYSFSDYNHLPSLVVKSHLLSANKKQDLTQLQRIVIEILSKTLNLYKERRYQSCEDLLEDLSKAIEIVNIAIYDQNQKGIEKANVRSIMGSYLYQYPFYNYVCESDHTMKVLFIGDNDDLFEGIDMAMQAGLMVGYRLQIVLASSTGATQEEYLRNRPFLKHIMHFTDHVPQVLPEKEESTYGDVVFITMDIHDEQALSDLIQQFPARYVVTGLEDDHESYRCALSISHYIHEKAMISYLSYTNLKESEDDHVIKALSINKTTSQAKIDPDLERMAFNLHMTWHRSKESQTEIIKSFHDPYNRSSSIASALTIPYKLKSIGLDMSQVNELQQLVETIDDVQKIDPRVKTLIQLEHRRWVVEKAIDGWSSYDDAKRYSEERYEYFADMLAIKNKDEKIHACLVPSTEDMPLLNYHMKDWNHTLKKEELDPLDELSVKFYQAVCARIEDNPFDVFSDQYIKKIEKKLKDEEAKAQFDQLKECIAHATHETMENPVYTKQYMSCYQDFKKYIEGKPLLTKILDLIHEQVAPYLIRNLPKDYKKLDIDIIRSLPFIISY